MRRRIKELDQDRLIQNNGGDPLRPVRRKRDSGTPTADLHSAGNQAAQGILRKVMPASPATVSSPGDLHEREADHLADQATAPQIQRNPLTPSTAPRAEAGEVSLALQASAGSSLDPAIQAKMESRLGQDFSEVRIHTGEQANASAVQLNARAYTVGNNIVFGAGQYEPQTSSGQHLLAHELAHVAQQSKSSVSGGPIQRQESLNQTLTDATGVPTTMSSVGFSATLAAGQNLVSDSEKTIHTVSDTRVEATVTSSRLTVNFTPELVITSNSFPYPNIWLEQIRFDFSTGTFSYSISARGGTWAAGWVSSVFGGSGVNESMTSGLSSLFSGLPADMRTPGYDPFADPNLGSNVSSFLSSFSSGSGSPGAGVPTASDIGINAEFVLGGEIRRSSGSFSLVIPSGTRVSVDVGLQGGIPESLRDVRVNRIRVQLYHPAGSSANVELSILGASLPVVILSSATFTSGGGLQFDYTEILEVGEFFFRSLIAAAAVESGQGGALGEDALDARQPRVHAVIDARIQQDLGPMLRDLILANRHAIPGMDLGEVLGYGPEMGDFPVLRPAGPNSGYG